MKRINVNQLENFIGQTVLVKGWVSQFRELKKMSFLILRERTGYCQIIIPKEISESLSPESVVEVIGTVKVESQSRYGGYEIVAESVKVTSVAQLLPFPINREEGSPLQYIKYIQTFDTKKGKRKMYIQNSIRDYLGLQRVFKKSRIY